jgi:hypothetical protein
MISNNSLVLKSVSSYFYTVCYENNVANGNYVCSTNVPAVIVETATTFHYYDMITSPNP